MVNNKIRQEEKRRRFNIFQSLTGCAIIVLTIIQLWNLDTSRIFLPFILLLGSGFTALSALKANSDKKGIMTLIFGFAAALLLALAIIGVLSLRR